MFKSTFQLNSQSGFKVFKFFASLLTLFLFICFIRATYFSSSDDIIKDSVAASKSNFTVTDFRGDLVQLNSSAKRIVALAPHIVENVYAAGAGDALVGAVAYSNFPEKAKSVVQVGSSSLVNQEKIVELNPDLIIAWESGNSADSVARLRELGFIVYIDQPNKIKDIAKSIRDIGLLTQQQGQANDEADALLKTIKHYETLYHSAEPVSVLYQVWNEPLQTINGQHLISDVIELCGGKNIYADEAALAPVINIESVLERDPQAIIASGMSDLRPDWLDDWKRWGNLIAVKQNNLFFVPPDHIQRHTSRIVLGIERVCTHLQQARENKASH